jgi:6-phosphogluconolactonase (cycloisomerase 2 family)
MKNAESISSMVNVIGQPTRLDLVLLALLFICFSPARLLAVDCNAAAREPLTYINLPGDPFQAISTPDGCWLFASLVKGSSNPSEAGIAVLRRADGIISLKRTLTAKELLAKVAVLGMVLTHDGKLLIATTDTGIAFLNVDALISGKGSALLGEFSDGPNAASIYVNVTADDHFAFVSDESQNTITVIDLGKAKSNGYSISSIVGKIPTAIAPIALTFSPDGGLLYSTSEIAIDGWGWPNTCPLEEPQPSKPDLRQPEGAILVIDVARAETNPESSVVAKVPAGCVPVRLVLSPDGERAYVSLRDENALAVFDAGKLVSDPAHARIARVPVGTAPVGVAVVNSGKLILVTNSNRFAGGVSDHQSVNIVADQLTATPDQAVVGQIPAGAFPRELHLTQDGQTLLLTNFNSGTLELVDLTRLAAFEQKTATH